MSKVLIDKAVLETIIGCADSYIEDINLGLEDGTYDASENEGIGDKEAALEAAKAVIEQSSVFPFLDCSTGHLTATTLRELGDSSLFDGLTVANYDYGCFLSVPPTDVDIDKVHAPLQEDLRIVLKFAQAKGCHVVRFDSDGDEIEGLPTYDHA